jgi:peptidyl-tRNA hydrolase, PTH1 family
MPEPEYLLVGLGNPGPEYERTPHNLGFQVLDRLAERNGIRITRKESMAFAGQGKVGGSVALLAKPQTFMNLSGPSVKGLLGKLELDVSRLILIYDELALPWGSIRVRAKGSAGGHHGVESVIRSVGSIEFPRVRLGIHPGFPVRDGAQFVLAPFAKAQLVELDALLDEAAQAVESIISEGVEKAMTKYNRRAQGEMKEEE